MSRQSILAEYWSFLRYRKKYWMVPIAFVLIFIGILLAFASTSSTIAPLLYPLL